MYLYIDTTERTSFTIALLKKDVVLDSQTVESEHKNSEQLLPKIDALLQKQKIKLTDLQGIVVVEGPGSFTSLRIGVVTANALAYALGIGIMQVMKTDSIDKIVELMDNTEFFKNIVLPKYGSEPKIS